MIDKNQLNMAIHCSCHSSEIDLLHDVLVFSEQAIAKSLMIREVALIARIETRMKEYLTKKWRNKVKYASKRAEYIYVNGESLNGCINIVDKIMNQWDEEVANRFGKDIENIYKHARLAGWKKANGQTTASLQYVLPELDEKNNVNVKKADTKLPELEPSFDLYDEQAIIQLQDDQMVWIGRHYNENIRDAIREGVSPTIIEGLGRVEAGKYLARYIEESLTNINIPKGFKGSDEKYFEGLAANTATNARVRGQIRSFSDIGVTRYKIVNPMDNRTSEICLFMNGKVFTIREGVSQMERVSGATSPSEIKKMHPWLSESDIKAIYSKGGTRALAKAGLALPPYHFKCRSTVDISSESISFGSLSKTEKVFIPKRSIPTKRNTPKNRKPTSRPEQVKASKRPAIIPKNTDILKAA